MTGVVSTAGDGTIVAEAHMSTGRLAQATLSTEHLTVTWIALDRHARRRLASAAAALAHKLAHLDQGTVDDGDTTGEA